MPIIQADPASGVGEEAVSVEVQATSLMMKNMCKSRNKIHRDAERGR